MSEDTDNKREASQGATNKGDQVLFLFPSSVFLGFLHRVSPHVATLSFCPFVILVFVFVNIYASYPSSTRMATLRRSHWLLFFLLSTSVSSLLALSLLAQRFRRMFFEYMLLYIACPLLISSQLTLAVDRASPCGLVLVRHPRPGGALEQQRGPEPH